MTEPITTHFASRLFSRSCLVRVHIRASPEHVWQLLMDTREVPRWTSTISQIEGEIREGQRLVLHVPGEPRPRTLTVSELQAPERMVWAGRLGRLVTGTRTIELHARPHGSTDLAVEERISGLGVPVARSALPDVGRAVPRFAVDLKAAAERVHAMPQRGR